MTFAASSDRRATCHGTAFIFAPFPRGRDATRVNGRILVSLSWEESKPETLVLVPVAGPVPVADSRPAVIGIVGPRAAATDPIRSVWHPMFLYHTSPKSGSIRN